MIYWLILILLLIGVRFDFKQKSKFADRYYRFECVVLILLMGLRYHVGGDSIRYEAYFNYAIDFKDIIQYGIVEQGGFQPLWLILQGLSKSIVDDFVLFQLIHCSIVVGLVFYLANKHCYHRFSFVVLFYFIPYTYFCTEIMRESLAVVFFMLGMDFLVNKRYAKYYLMSLIAFLFHAGAIFLLVIPFLYSLLSKPANYKILFIMGAGIFVFNYFFDFFLQFTTNVIFKGNSLIENKSEILSNSSGLNIFGILAELFFSFPVLFVFRNLKNSSISHPYSLFVVNMYLVTIFISFFYMPLNRLQNYFVIPFLFVFIDFMYDSVIVKKHKYILNFCIFLLIISKINFFVRDIPSDNNLSLKKYRLYYPYSSVLSPEEDYERERFIESQF